jgi:molecular chaperone GrpE
LAVLLPHNLKTIMAAKKEKKTAQKEVKQEAQESVVERNELLENQEALEAEKNKFLRLFAEFENYKKRTAKERIELFKTASQEVMVALLPVLDDFERALSELDKADDKLTGIQLIYNKFFDTLKQQGLKNLL